MTTKLSKLKEECAKLKQSNKDLKEQVKKLKCENILLRNILAEKMNERVDSIDESL